MKQKHLLLLTTLFLCGPLAAQQPTQLEATYLCQLNGTEKQGTLLTTETQSLYFYNKNGKNTKKNIQQKEDNIGNQKLSFKITSSDSIGPQVYINYVTNSLIARRLLFFDLETKVFRVHEDLPKIPWQLTDEQKQLGKFICQKATCSFRGRDYIAWFTAEIPLSRGPYKFQGLPGLIVELYDVTQTYYYLLQKVSTELVDDEAIAPPSSGKEITIQEYAKLQKQQVSNLEKRIQAKLPRGTSVEFTRTKVTNMERSYEFEEQ